MGYHKTKDILHVMNLLGHKNIKNRLIYIKIEAATFSYICEIDYVKLFEKRK